MKPRRNNRRRKTTRIALLPKFLKAGMIWLANNPLIILASLIASFIGLTDIRIPVDWLIDLREWARHNALSAVIAFLILIVIFRWASSPIEEENDYEADNESANRKILDTVPEKPPLIIIVNNSEEALKIIKRANPSNNLLDKLPKSEVSKPRIATEADVKVWKAPHTPRTAASSKPKKNSRN